MTSYRNRLSIVLTYACMRWRNRLENRHTIRLGLQRAYVQCVCVCKLHSHIDERKIHMRRASLFSFLLSHDSLHRTRFLAHTKPLSLFLYSSLTIVSNQNSWTNLGALPLRLDHSASAYFHLLLLATFDGIESNKFYFEFDAYNFLSSAQNTHDVCLYSAYEVESTTWMSRNYIEWLANVFVSFFYFDFVSSKLFIGTGAIYFIFDFVVK